MKIVYEEVKVDINQWDKPLDFTAKPKIKQVRESQ